MIARYGRLMILSMTALELLLSCASVSAGEKIDVGHLTEAVRQCESRVANASFEVSIFQWADSKNQRPDSTEIRRIVQWQDRFYESVLSTNSLLEDDQETSERFTWCDGEIMTVYSPPDQVDEFTGDYPSIPRFQLYATLLATLGYDGTLSQFLEQDQQTVAPLAIEVSPAESSGILAVRGTRQLPGSNFVRVIELHLAIDQDYLPFWGRYSEIDGDECLVKAESRVSSLADATNDQPKRQEICVTRFDDPDNETRRAIKVIQIISTPLEHQPSDCLFKPTDFVGNPTILRYEDAKLLSRGPYHPPVVRNRRLLPPIVMWVVINSLLFGLIILWRRPQTFSISKSVRRLGRNPSFELEVKQ